MIHKLYNTFGSGELRSNAAKAFKLAQDAPVMVLNRTVPQVVMVSPELWNQTAERLAYLERVIQGLQADTRIAAGEYDTLEDVERELS